MFYGAIEKKQQSDDDNYYFSIDGELIPVEITNFSKSNETIVVECTIVSANNKTTTSRRTYLEKRIKLPLFNLSFTRRFKLD